MASTGTFQPDKANLSPRNMFFPPPPTTETRPANAKKPVPFAFGFKSQSRPSTDSSSISSFTLQKPPRPILKNSIKSTKRTRQWILLAILLCSFTTLILSVIFAYCAALPHSDNIADAQASSLASAQGFSGPTTSTISLIAASTATPLPSATTTKDASAQTSAYSYSPRNLRWDTPTIAIPDPEMTQEEFDSALARDAANQYRFSTSSARMALTFYTATLPLLTILHTAVELLISLIHPETSQNTRLGDMFLFRTRDAVNNAVRKRRTGTLLSFTASSLLLLGWIVMQIFTINCEIATFGNGGEAVCPVQIRGHRMGGISELSVGKVVLVFATMVGYLGYCVYLVRVVGVFGGKEASGRGRVSSFKRRARFASRERKGEGQGQGHGDVESVVIGLDMGLQKEGGKGVVGA